jgi:hypothetical protein
MIDDPIMKWCVDARNFIVKEGDLETLSVAQVSLLNSHNEAKRNIFSVDPRLTGIEIARLIKEKYLPNQLTKYGYLQVERQWITKELDGIELLSGLAHAFTVLKLLVEDIEFCKGPQHVYKSKILAEHEFSEALEFLSESDKPTCMLAFEEYRTTNYNLGTGEDASLNTEVVTLDKESLPNIKDRYGDIKSTLGSMGKSLEERVDYHLTLAKGILKTDGYHLTTVAIFDSSDRPYMISIAFRDNEDKYLFWRDVAKKIKRLRAKMIITVGDSWRAKLDPSNPLKLGQGVADLSDKEEVIMVVGMNRDGDVVTVNTPYTREAENISFGYDEKVDMQPEFLNPIAKAFKKLKRP